MLVVPWIVLQELDSLKVSEFPWRPCGCYSFAEYIERNGSRCDILLLEFHFSFNVILQSDAWKIRQGKIIAPQNKVQSTKYWTDLVLSPVSRTGTVFLLNKNFNKLYLT